jgi:hypothetical protein
MILVRCIKNVYGNTGDAARDLLEARLLFRADYLYMADHDGNGHLLTQDEEGQPHVIADGQDMLSGDSWFHEHFTVA